MKFIVVEKETPQGLLLIVTDKDIFGKKFEEGKVQLDLTKSFYEGNEKEKDEVKELFFKSRHVHLTGKQTIALGIELDCVDPKRILWVKGIPHAQVVMEG